MITFRQDSIANPGPEALSREELLAKLTAQEATNELLKGCIMELADIVYGDSEEATTT
ncbi:MAG: hypothetical protein VB078_00170 [Clostridiaceae bacterium]|nr:hypothetical protein [Clostridiaceae bacterium]DAM37352.1 MAG TPA: hypothetical protein [Caudoviricetes sp.]